MKVGLRLISFIVIFLFFVGLKLVKANSELHASNSTIKVDFRSMHVWRGIATSFTPSIEPSFEVTKNNSTTGIWLAQSIDSKYTELDLYFVYHFEDFSFTLFDYYCPPSIRTGDEITNFEKYSTHHTFELNLAYNGNEKIPFSFLVATMIYGDDIRFGTKKNNYSTYFQFGYSTKIDENFINLILGFNAFESYYGNQFGVINAGITASRNFKAFKFKEIPVQASLITNPMSNSLFLTFGFTL
jgi:hypothetical protein